MPKMVEANKMIRGFLTTERHTRFVDVYRLMLDKHGDPQKDLFLEDQLHMNSKGYAIWTKALKPYLLK